MNEPTVHASAVKVGDRGVLVRGASGSGKSSLVLQLLSADPARNSLVADDRVELTARDGRLMASPPANLAGLLEIRGQGILRVPHVAPVAIDLVVDLVHENESPRMPTAAERGVTLSGVPLPRVFVAQRAVDGVARVHAALSWPVLETS